MHRAKRLTRHRIQVRDKAGAKLRGIDIQIAVLMQQRADADGKAVAVDVAKRDEIMLGERLAHRRHRAAGSSDTRPQRPRPTTAPAPIHPVPLEIGQRG